jgi:hypothetical protein
VPITSGTDVKSLPGSSIPRICGLLAAFLVSFLGHPGPACADDSVRANAIASVTVNPLSGIVRANGIPVAGARLIVRTFAGGAESIVRILKSSSDGTFVWSDATPGLYSILSIVPGFRPTLVRFLHRADQRVSFVALDLEPASGVLPRSAHGLADPWIGRAVGPADVLRDTEAVLAARDDCPNVGPPITLASAVSAQENGALTRVPLRASVVSMTGFGAEGSSALSRTSLDVSGMMGESVRWGVEGQYRRLASLNGQASGDSSRVSLDVAPGPDQSIRVSSRQQVLPGADSDASRFSSQAVDWSGATSDRSHASVSAHLISQSNLLQNSPASELFARTSNAFEVLARYRTDTETGNFVRFAVSYRSLSGASDLASTGLRLERETRVGGTAGIQVFEALTFEGGATGDFSERTRGITPELTVTVKMGGGWRIYGFAARRTERRLYEDLAPGWAGTDEADLGRLSRAVYRGGIGYESADGESFSFEGSERELGGTYRLLFDPEFLDNLDSLYFFEGDVAQEVSFGTTFHIGHGLDGRISARAGHIQGERLAVISRDSGWYQTANAAVRITPTGTSLGVGYREVSQELTRSESELRNDLESVDFTIAQSLPIPFLRSLGSDWRALFSIEFGQRRQGEDEERSNRRFAGGLALSF